MIELDGIEYQINTPEENAGSMLTAINTWCQRNNIQNRHGELIQLEANFANPLYTILFGVGYLASALQNLIYSAGCALSVQASSDKQLLNIADIANLKRKDPTKTTILCVVYSDLIGGNACRITTDLSVTITVSGSSIIFHPAYDITIPVAESRAVMLVAETLGSYSVAEGVLSGFDENPEGFRSMYSYASVPGQDQESITSLRDRIQRRTESSTKQDLAAEAIGQLNGVSVCNIYFNKSSSTAETVMGVEVAPRQSLIFVQGFSNDIARTYWSYMDAECSGRTHTQAIEQVYTTASGQELPVYIIPPEQKIAYIRLYFNQLIDDVTAQSMRDTIATLASKMTIGEVLTSTAVVDIIQENYTQAPAGCQLSFDDETYGYQLKPDTYQLITFSTDSTVVQIYGTQS